MPGKPLIPLEGMKPVPLEVKLNPGKDSKHVFFWLVIKDSAFLERDEILLFSHQVLAPLPSELSLFTCLVLSQ